MLFLLFGVASAQDYSGICQDPGMYNATQCDGIMDHFTTEPGTALYGVDLDTADCFDLTGPNNDTIFSLFENIVPTYDCCNGGVSRCFVDFSHTCENPSNYTPEGGCSSLWNYYYTNPEVATYRQDPETVDCTLAVNGYSVADIMQSQADQGCCSGNEPRCVPEVGNYSGICADPSMWIGGLFVDPNSTFTCQDYADYLGSEAELTMAPCNYTLPSNGASVGETIGQLAGLGCCSGQEPRCTGDFSGMCADPNNYNGQHALPFGGTCGSWLAQMSNSPEHIFYGVDFATESCQYEADNSTLAQEFYAWAVWYGCCDGDDASRCAPAPQDFSTICENQADYLPTHVAMSDAFDVTCEDLLPVVLLDQSLPLYDADIPTISCDYRGGSADPQESAGQLFQFAAGFFGCCSNLKSRCWEDYSGLCLNPAEYMPNYLAFVDMEDDEEDYSCDRLIARTIDRMDIPSDFTTANCDPALTAELEALAQMGCCADMVSRCGTPGTTGDMMTTSSDPMTTGSDPMTTGDMMTTGSDPMTTGSDPMTTGSDPMTTGSDPMTTGAMGTTADMSGTTSDMSGTTQDASGTTEDMSATTGQSGTTTQDMSGTTEAGETTVMPSPSASPDASVPDAASKATLSALAIAVLFGLHALV